MKRSRFYSIKSSSILIGALLIVSSAIILIPSCVTQPKSGLALQIVASGLDHPGTISCPPGDTHRLFVLEVYTGLIRIVKDGTLLNDPFLDLSSVLGPNGNERGLLGLTFHPDYSSNGYFYVDYIDVNGNTMVERYTASGNADQADASTAKTILQITQNTDIHKAGALAFGPDGYLYIAVGDGGPQGDTDNHGQSLDTLLGKILRIDVDGGDPYAVPSDNPFAHTDGLDEIWTYGLRNPWRITFDRLTGDLWIADVGFDSREEIDFQPANSTGGENYGWRVAEGFACRGGNDSCGTDPGFVPPLIDYDHTTGQCIIGGYVYRGSALDGFDGTYFYGDFSASKVFTVRNVDGVATNFTDRTASLEPGSGPQIGKITSFGEDANGELYFCNKDGDLFKIVPKP